MGVLFRRRHMVKRGSDIACLFLASLILDIYDYDVEAVMADITSIDGVSEMVCFSPEERKRILRVLIADSTFYGYDVSSILENIEDIITLIEIREELGDVNEL